MAIIEKLKGVYNFVSGQAHSAAVVNDNDDERAYAPDSTILPPNPFSCESHTTVDLTSTPSEEATLKRSSHKPVSTIRRRVRKEAGRTTPHTKATDGISPDELRLIGDFTTPANRVLAPDPASYFEKKTPMPSKPSSSRSFKPINTLDVNRGPHATRPVTYGKKAGRIPQNAIGHRQGCGQAQYNARNHGNATGACKYESRRGTDAPATKRAKRDHHPEVIDLSDEDHGDAGELVSKHFSGTRPGPRSSHIHLPISRSQLHTVDTKAPFQQPSEFEQTNALTSTSHKRSTAVGRRTGQPLLRRSLNGLDDRRSSSPMSQSLATRRNSEYGKLQPVHSLARRAMFEEIQQGERNLESDIAEVATKHKSPGTCFFPRARINESTEGESLAGNTAAVPVAPEFNDLRGFRRASPSSEDDSNLVSGKSHAVQSGNRSPTKATRLRNQKSTTENRRPTMEGRALALARTHQFESNSQDGNWYLRRSNISRSTWIMGKYSGENKEWTHIGTISAEKVNRGRTDGIRRIRLGGSLQSDGNVAIFDLEFVDHDDLVQFRAEVDDSSIGKISNWTEEQMVKMFATPLLQNRKSGSSLAFKPPSSIAGDAQAELRNRRSGTLLSQLPANPMQQASASMREPSRALRSTQHPAPTYDEERFSPETKVEKYSVDVGLGTPWKGTLSYGEGRQKATVNFDDLQRLDEEEFLNDSLIEFYMIYLFKKHQVPSDKVFFFNTYFYSQLTKGTRRGEFINYEAVKRWTSRVDIFNYDYIVVPINELTHWYLAIICNVGNIQRKPAKVDVDLRESVEASPSHEKEHEPTSIVQDTQEEDVVTALLLEQQTPGGSLKNITDNGTNAHTELDDEAASELNLINAEEIDPPPQMDSAEEDISNGHDLESAHVDTSPRTVLSNLKTLPARKKAKRRSIMPKKDPEQPIIIVLDSLSGTRSPAVRALKEWLAAEGMDKRGMEAVIKENGFYPKASHIPVQQNFSDCGVYLLGYVDKLFEDPDKFKIELLTGKMSATNDWPNLQPKMMRNSLRDIIFNLAAEQRLTEKQKRPKKTVPTTGIGATNATATIPLQKAGSHFVASTARETSEHESHGEKQETYPVATTPLSNHSLDDPVKPRLGSPIRLGKILARNSDSNHRGHDKALQQVEDNEPPNVQIHTKAPTPAIALGEMPIVPVPPQATRAQEDDDGDMLFNNNATTPVPSPSPSRSRTIAIDMDNEEKLGKAFLAAQAIIPVSFTLSPGAFKQPMSSKDHTRMGSEDDPIQLEDSQERRALATATKSKTAKRVFQPKTVDRSATCETAGALRSAPVVLNRDIYDEMDIDGEELGTSVTVSQDVEMKDDDDTIVETPPSRSSPPVAWQTGQSLPA